MISTHTLNREEQQEYDDFLSRFRSLPSDKQNLALAFVMGTLYGQTVSTTQAQAC